MQIEDVTTALEADGWRKYPDTRGKSGNEVTYILCKRTTRADLPECQCNNNPVRLVLRPFRMRFADGKKHESWALDLTADAGAGRWVQFKEYGIATDDLLALLPSAIDGLEAAWKIRAM